jgi:hypothetical protein
VIGDHDGKKQNLVAPGLVLGRFPLWKRVGFTISGGYQIATTQFQTTNHNGILSVRFPFLAGSVPAGYCYESVTPTCSRLGDRSASDRWVMSLFSPRP